MIAHQSIQDASIKEQIHRTVSESIGHHVAEHFGQSRTDEKLQHPRSKRVARRRRRPEGAARSFKDQTTLSGHKDMANSIYGPQPILDRWRRKSSTGSQRLLTRNPIFGTMSIRTTTSLYTREDAKGRRESRQVTISVLVVLPPSWLTSRGIVFKHHESQILGCDGGTGFPHWTLSTFNIVDQNSEIFQACLVHDLRAIRRLFDSGRASPYDVDSAGRNLLGFVAVGLQVCKAFKSGNVYSHVE